MKKTELLDLISYLFATGSIGTRGEINNNGADSYECPDCGAWKYIRGHANRTGTMSDVEHDKDCKLYKLWLVIKSYEASK